MGDSRLPLWEKGNTETLLGSNVKYLYCLICWSTQCEWEHGFGNVLAVLGFHQIVFFECWKSLMPLMRSMSMGSSILWADHRLLLGTIFYVHSCLLLESLKVAVLQECMVRVQKDWWKGRLFDQWDPYTFGVVIVKVACVSSWAPAFSRRRLRYRLLTTPNANAGRVKGKEREVDLIDRDWVQRRIAA